METSLDCQRCVLVMVRATLESLRHGYGRVLSAMPYNTWTSTAFLLLDIHIKKVAKNIPAPRLFVARPTETPKLT